MRIPFTGIEIELAGRGRPSQQTPKRQSSEYPSILTGPKAFGEPKPLPKPTPVNLRRLMETPNGRRALNSVKNPLLRKNYEVRPKRGFDLDDSLRREIQIAENILEEPNPDDSFYSFMSKLIDDLLTGAWGPVESRENANPDHPWWLYNVDGPTIHVVPGWDGSPNKVRYAQQFGGLAKPITFTDREMFYIKPNPRTHTPFGLGPGEIAFNTINYFLGANKAAHRIASNERASTILHLGKDAKPHEVLAFRNYWIDEIEGTGATPIIGGTEEPNVLKLGTGTDAGLNIKWQEFLMVLIANSFDISPGKMGISRDVNRSTKDGMMQEDEETAVDPWSLLLCWELSRHLLWKRLNFRRLQVTVDKVDLQAALVQAKIHDYYVRMGALTLNEVRADINRGPLPEDHGNLGQNALPPGRDDDPNALT